MKKIMKRFLTGVLSLAAVFTTNVGCDDWGKPDWLLLFSWFQAVSERVRTQLGARRKVRCHDICRLSLRGQPPAYG